MITGFCTSFAGEEIIQRGDYRLLKPDDDQVIQPSNLYIVAQAGKTLEMSIVLHQQRHGNSRDERKCPRCKHINRKIITASGWISW